MQRRIGPIVDSLRAEVRLPPVGRSFTEWTFSSELVVALFPQWFAPDLAEVPLPTVYTEFPRFDGMQEFTRSDELTAFLDAGDPPILLSESSLASQSGDSNGFDLSLEACRRIGRRAILLSADERRVPTPLPNGVGYFGYLPLSTILPHCAAFVHHGGLGSLSQALAAGIPQVTIPRFMDQPDNSRHLEALGISRNLNPRRISSEMLAQALSELIKSPSVLERCQSLKTRVQSEVPFTTASEAVEQLARLSRLRSPQTVLC
jgi:UDP:flavonoid glycosyltransferase YjiC (YdhE family)